MTHLAKTTKILEFFNKTIIEQLEEFYQLLLAGDLRTYESKLNESLIMIQELINEEPASHSGQRIATKSGSQRQSLGRS